MNSVTEHQAVRVLSREHKPGMDYPATSYKRCAF